MARNRSMTLVVLTLLLPLFPTGAGAQVVGAILTGTIVDPSGVAVVGTTVTIRNVETGIVTVTQTKGGGRLFGPKPGPG